MQRSKKELRFSVLRISPISHIGTFKPGKVVFCFNKRFERRRCNVTILFYTLIEVMSFICSSIILNCKLLLRMTGSSIEIKMKAANDNCNNRQRTYFDLKNLLET